MKLTLWFAGIAAALCLIIRLIECFEQDVHHSKSRRCRVYRVIVDDYRGGSWRGGVGGNFGAEGFWCAARLFNDSNNRNGFSPRRQSAATALVSAELGGELVDDSTLTDE